MDEVADGSPRRQRSISLLGRLGLTIRRSAGGVVPVRVLAGIQASLLLLLLGGCATPDWRGHNPLERGRQDIVAAHPEWPPEIRGAVASGVICAGMSPEMVRAAWGHPIRISSDGSALTPHDIWYDAGRQPLAEWTVLFAHSGVVGWTE